MSPDTEYVYIHFLPLYFCLYDFKMKYSFSPLCRVSPAADRSAVVSTKESG